MKYAISVLSSTEARVLLADFTGMSLQFDSWSEATVRTRFVFAELEPIVVPVEGAFTGEFGDV